MADVTATFREDGLYDADIVAASGLHKATLYRWLANPDIEPKCTLRDRLKKADVGFKRVMLGAIKGASEESSANWTAAAWLLERKWPQQYGRCEREIAEEGPLPVQLTLGI